MNANATHGLARIKLPLHVLEQMSAAPGGTETVNQIGSIWFCAV